MQNVLNVFLMHYHRSLGQINTIRNIYRFNNILLIYLFSRVTMHKCDR